MTRSARPSVRSFFLVALPLTLACSASEPSAAQQLTDDPYPSSLLETAEVIEVDYVEFAQVPEYQGGPPRMMHLVDEPGTEQMFVSDMWGYLYSVSYDGETVTEYLDLTDSRWGVAVQARGSERGLQSFAFHPQFGEEGTPGYGKFYTWLDVAPSDESDGSAVDFTTPNDEVAQHTVLLEWTAEDASAATYDGGPPRVLMRFAQPFGNHNGGQLGFNPTVSPGDADFGLLYIGVGDGGSGGDPMNLGQDTSSGFGKLLRIDPLGSNSDNGAYGIPADNPFADDGDPNTLGEIYAYGLRNPQRFAWDPANGTLFLADIGQNTIEELNIVTLGDNLGWNDWEGSYPYISRDGVDGSEYRSDPSVTYPIAEYGHTDPTTVGGRAAVSGVNVYRSDEIPQLEGLVIFGDNPSGEIFFIDADDPPEGGEEGVGRILLNDDGEAKTLLQLVQEKIAEEGLEPSDNVDLRIGTGPEGQVLLLNKFDGVIRMLVP